MDFQSNIDDFLLKKDMSINKTTIGDIVCYHVEMSVLVQLISLLKDHKDFRFTILTDLFASDFPERTKRFELVYNLLSLKLNKRLILKVQAGINDKVPSLSSVYNAACWYEREAFDMFGIEFDGALDQRRILTDYGFTGHPLRKDFPLSGHTQVTYDKKLGKVVYEPVLLEQEYRDFDYCSPWKGPEGMTLPGDEKATK